MVDVRSSLTNLHSSLANYHEFFSIDGWCQGALPVNICHLHVHAIPVASSRQVSCRSNFYISKHGQKFLQVKMTFLLELDRSCAHNFRFRCVWKWLGFSQFHRNKTCLKWFFHFNCENDLWVLGLIQQKRWSTFYLGNVSSTSTQLSSKIMATAFTKHLPDCYHQAQATCGRGRGLQYHGGQLVWWTCGVQVPNRNVTAGRGYGWVNLNSLPFVNIMAASRFQEVLV